MNNLRFSTAIHILVLLDFFNDRWLTSEFISGSINVNAVVIRKELSSLKKAELIESKQGKEGGCKLAKKAEDIFLSDIYLAIQNNHLISKLNQPNPNCIIGNQMNKNLGNLFQDVEVELLNKLSKMSLKDFSNQFKK